MFYDAGGANQANAIFYTATYLGTGPCALSVSSSGGGFITVADFNHTVLYLAPTGFGVLIDAGRNASYNIPGYPNGFQSLDTNELYDVATGVASQTATSLNQDTSGDRTFLPTIGAVLSVGSVGLKADISINTGPPYVNSELFVTASQRWASAGTPVGGNTNELGLVTLHSGDALLVGSTDHYINSTYQYSDNQIFSAATRAWSETAPLPVPRMALGFSLLRDGRVLASGGLPYYGTAPLEGTSYDIADLYDPLAGTWSSKSAHTSNCTICHLGE